MKGFRLQVLVYSFLFVLLSTVTCSLYPISAAESSPSADIKSKLEELKKEIASKAAKLKGEVNKKLKDKAYIGKVKTVSASSITLAGRTGPKIITLNQDTIYESIAKSKTKITQKNIEQEDNIAALGDIDETGVLIAKKIILLLPTTYNLPPKTFLWGQILSISDRLITIKDKDQKNHAVSLADESLKVGDFVILTGFLGKNDIFEADFAHVIPQGFIRSKKIATPSAKTSSPSATPKVSPKTKTSPKTSPSPKPSAR